MKLPVFLNLGNTCYLNSVLQCFIHNDNFKKIIDNGTTEMPFYNELQRITNIIDSNVNGEYMAFIHNLNNILPFFPFKRFEQQDAHECILTFLDLLIQDNKTHPFFKMYHGSTRTSILCKKCNTVKNVHEDFNSINLNIPIQQSSNVTDLFIKYLDTELYDSSDNLYFCETCNNLECYEKKVYLDILPEVFIVVLKRYTFTGSKIISDVSFHDNMVIKEHSTGEIKQYKLNSVINHIGNLYNGHYTNYISKNVLMHIDDEKIRVDESINNENAYILFYNS